MGSQHIPDGFNLITKSPLGKSKQILVGPNLGPPVVIMHELFGVTDSVIAFCRMIGEAGFKTYTPVMFGSAEPKSSLPDKAVRAAKAMCLAHEFRMFQADESGPWADWLRALVDELCADTGADGVGVIGLCLTGNFALSMAVNPKVKAAIMGEPSLPLGDKQGLHATSQEIGTVRARAGEGFCIHAYRFELDSISPPERLLAYEDALGDAFKGHTIKTNNKKHHSVFTEHLRDESGVLRHDKVQEVISHLKARLPV